MLNQEDDRFTVKVTCPACQVTFVMILALQAPGLESVHDVHVEIEVDPDEVDVLVGRSEPTAGIGPGPIELDELLDLHLILKDYRGPLSELVKQHASH